jgi:uncharacterized protein DUF6544
MTASAARHADSHATMTPMDMSHLPALVRSYLARSLPSSEYVPARVRVQQAGEMWKQPGAKAMRFEATEDFAVEHVAFSWRARFPIVGPLAMTVVDEMADGVGQLRVSLLGIPLQTKKGTEATAGQATRYLAELAWAPQAIAANRELEWREIDANNVEVACEAGGDRAAVRWQFNHVGDLVGATGERPYAAGKTFVPRPWGGDFAGYAGLGGVRVPTYGEAWWHLPEGRFVYWRGRISALQLIGTVA